MINFIIVLGVGIAFALAVPEDVFEKWIRYIAVGCGGGSGGLAMAIAQQKNQGGDK